MSRALPRGKVRPPIEAPTVGGDVEVGTPTSVRIVKLTSYQFVDDSEYTWREFDYRLRWTMHITHRSMAGAKDATAMDADGTGTVGHAHAVVDVWSRRHADWHQVWELHREAVSPYSQLRDLKVQDWNRLLAALAAQATVVLL